MNPSALICLAHGSEEIDKNILLYTIQGSRNRNPEMYN